MLLIPFTPLGHTCLNPNHSSSGQPSPWSPPLCTWQPLLYFLRLFYCLRTEHFHPLQSLKPLPGFQDPDNLTSPNLLATALGFPEQPCQVLQRKDRSQLCQLIADASQSPLIPREGLKVEMDAFIFTGWGSVPKTVGNVHPHHW